MALPMASIRMTMAICEFIRRGQRIRASVLISTVLLRRAAGWDTATACTSTTLKLVNSSGKFSCQAARASRTSAGQEEQALTPARAETCIAFSYLPRTSCGKRV